MEKMTTALYKQIYKNNSYREKVKNVIDFDDVIDHLISKDIVGETEYIKIWNEGGNKLDLLFDILSSKTDKILKECFDVFKSVYGDEFEILLKSIRQDILDYVHLKGGFPKINKYIPRIEEETKLKEKFANIKWDNSLVVYGRVGEGKSYLVSECLKDEELIWEYFDNRLFWINVGDFENGNNILQPLTRLLQMLAPRKRKVYDLDYLVEKLQKIFASERHRKSLVILDNARSLEVIEIFQSIRCKLIIITHFKTVQYAEFVEVFSGFTLNETVSLFAQYLETSYENLNNFFLDDIKDIHELCKGHPSTLALLGVILSCKREHALHSKCLWDYIKEKIDKGEMEDLSNDDADIRTNFHKALKMCIDTIKTDEMKDLYYQFAVFPKDANISTEVLEVFWGKGSQEVEDIMLHFENRSLINSFYNIKKKVYIYVIHDLFLYYLKNETKAQKKEFHRKLINSYEKRYEFNMLPDDNYILLFLGYHLKQAEMIDKFEKFLDLRFIDHKIRMVGVNNMEHDLKMYRDEIINEKPHLKKKLENCLKFIKDNKNELRQLQKTDIVQLALPTLKADAQMLMVRNQANSINKLYFTIKLSAGRLKSSQEIILKEEVTAMAFCLDSNVSKILIGLENGDILLYCSQTNKEFDRFQGHKQLVFDLKVAQDNTCFLSVSEDRTVKLWNFFAQRSSFDGINDVPTSPKCVQSEYYHVFSSGKRNNFKEFIYNEDNAYLVSASFSNNYGEIKRICTGTNNGKVILWNAYTREKLFTTTETGFSVENIYFSHDDSKLLLTKQEKIQIYKYQNEELTYFESIHNLEDIVKLFVPNENTLISVGSKHVMMYKLPYEDDSNRIKVYESREYNITCSAVARGEYFAIGIREKVFLFSVSSGQLVETLEHNKIVTSISMDVSRDDENITSMILMNFDDNNIQQCNIMMQHYGQPRNKQGLVTTYWKNKNTPLLALVLNDNILKIQHEFNTINEVEKPHRISFITFSLCGNNIIFSLENGKIMEYQYKRQGCFKTLMMLNSAVKYLQCFESEFPLDDNLSENYSSSDSDNGVIVAVTDGDKKIHVLLDGGQLNNFSWDLPIFHVFPMASHRLLCIDESGGVFVIHILKNKEDVQLINYGSWGRKVTSASYCSGNNLVALTFTKQDHSTNHLEVINVTSKQILRTLFLDFVPKCCAFSYLGGLLVLGSEDGKIMICNIHENFKIKLRYTTLPIKFIQFSPSSLPILVTVGREISWWNLCNFETDDVSNENLTLRNSEFDLAFWENKTIHNEIPNLLQTVSLYSNAVHVSVSKNFETFLVVDDESRIYVMKCFKNVQ